ncbi:MAG: hypothetical protein RBT02_06635 [Bacteroidales bacterium]|nr:hypothetical protein [Bacteroidales bacterium]
MKGRKRRYIRPAVIRIELDNSISLVMMTSAPPHPPRRGSGDSQPDSPFASPFSDKPFS